MKTKAPQQHPQAREVFPGYLKRVRATRRFTQEELARKSDMSLSAVTKYENGYHLPTPTQLGKLADAFGLSGPARGALFLAAGYAPIGSSIKIEGVEVFDFDEDDREAPIIHALSSAA